MTKTETLSPEKADSAEGPHPESRWKRASFRLVAVALALCPFVLLEAALRLSNVGNPTDYEDPFVGFSRTHPLFETDVTSGLRRTAPSRQMHFGRQEFPIEKGPSVFRIFCLGGSTVHGRPYQADTAFPKWLEIELQGSDPSHVYQVINCGGVSYASYRLVPILQEVLSDSPDLIIVATGHNEFLEDRTYQDVKSRSGVRRWLEDHAHSLRTITLARKFRDVLQPTSGVHGARAALAQEVDARLDHASGYASYHRDESWRRGVIRHFAQSIRAMIQLCSRSDVPILLVNLGCNLRDCPPFKSELDAKLRPEPERRWQAAFDTAAAAEATDLEQALDLYRQAQQIDDNFALLDYRIARCLDRMGRLDEAALCYRQAKEKDVCPLRILDAMHETILSASHESGTPLVDAKQLFEELSPGLIPGFHWYLDHVHPTVGGHQRIAQAIAAELRHRSIVPSGSSWGHRDRRRAYRQHLERLSPGYWADGEVRVGWLESWSRRHRLLQELAPQDWRGYLDHGHRELDFGNIEKAWEAYLQALKRDPDSAAKIVRRACELINQGRPEFAFRVLDRLRTTVTSNDVLAQIDLAMLIAAAELEDWERAVAIYETSGDALQQLTRQPDTWGEFASQDLEHLLSDLQAKSRYSQ